MKPWEYCLEIHVNHVKWFWVDVGDTMLSTMLFACCCLWWLHDNDKHALLLLWICPEIHVSCVSYVWFRAALDITWTLSLPCWLPLPFEFLVEDVYWWWTCIDYMIPCCGVICCCSCCSKLVLWCLNPAAVLKPYEHCPEIHVKHCCMLLFGCSRNITNTMLLFVLISLMMIKHWVMNDACCYDEYAQNFLMNVWSIAVVITMMNTLCCCFELAHKIHMLMFVVFGHGCWFVVWSLLHVAVHLLLVLIDWWSWTWYHEPCC